METRAGCIAGKIFNTGQGFIWEECSSAKARLEAESAADSDPVRVLHDVVHIAKAHKQSL